MAQLEHIRTSVLEIACEQAGPVDAVPVVLLHGFPYDPRAFDDVASIVNATGLRTIVPYLRGYGGTRFLSADTMRSGEQAAIGCDLLELLDALKIREAVLAGFDWGERDSPPTAMNCAGCCGGSGRRAGNSTRRASRARRRPSPIPISWRW